MVTTAELTACISSTSFPCHHLNAASTFRHCFTPSDAHSRRAAKPATQNGDSRARPTHSLLIPLLESKYQERKALSSEKGNPTGIATVMAGLRVLQRTLLEVTSIVCHQRPSFTWSYLTLGSTGSWRFLNQRRAGVVLANGEGTSSTQISSSPTEEDENPDPQDLEYVSQIKRVLELLRKNRDMLFNEVKLTVMIEDPRDVERRRLLGIDDENAPSRDDLAAALVEVNEGKVPKDRAALQMLAEEMSQWPNLEVEAQKTKQPGQSLYAKFTDTGVDPKEAAKRLNIDWDSAAEIEDAETDDVEVPPAVGYGALYLVTAFPVIIGISVVLILFYNSLQ